MSLVFRQRIAFDNEVIHSSAHVVRIGLDLQDKRILTRLEVQFLRNSPAPHIHYVGIEKYPVPIEEALQLNFPDHITKMQHLLHSGELLHFCKNGADSFSLDEIKIWFKSIHTIHWENDIEIAPSFNLTKINADITECTAAQFKSRIYPKAPSVIYYDTFSPATQPNLWEKSIFEQIFTGTNTQSVLTTYCSKGIVKQALRDVGFKLERLPGPPGKRHILRATKLS